MRRWDAKRVGTGFAGVELTEHNAGKFHVVMPRDSQSVRNHSPDGFEMGYAGSGPAQLALAILLRYFRGEVGAALVLYQDFKFEFVTSAPRDGFSISELEIDAWIENLPSEARDRLRKVRV